jgi:aspartate dehydrogenase
LIGLGAIGTKTLGCLARASREVRVVGALVAHPDKHVHSPCPVFEDSEALIRLEPDLVIECASQRALIAFGARVLASSIDLIAASVGALADDAVSSRMRSAAAGNAKLYIPSGALAGVDALAAARPIGISRVRYTRRAPPSVWLRSGAIDADRATDVRAPFHVYRGNAREAALKYPKNANVTATIALAGLGFERTEVELIADPGSPGNIHRLDADGEFGQMHCEISTTVISGASTSSQIVAGSLARAVLSRVERIVLQ